MLRLSVENNVATVNNSWTLQAGTAPTLPSSAVEKARDGDRFAIPGLRRHRSYLRLTREKTVGVPGTVDVEADELTVIVEAVDGGRPDAVGVVDRLPVRILQRIGQYEAVH